MSNTEGKKQMEEFLEDKNNQQRAWQFAQGIERRMGKGWFTLEYYAEKTKQDIAECKSRLQFASMFDYIVSKAGTKGEHKGKVIHKLVYDYQDHIDIMNDELEAVNNYIKSLKMKLKYYKDLKKENNGPIWDGDYFKI